MEQENLRNALLNLDYSSILRSCQVNPNSREICEDPAFWEQKAKRDFGISLSSVSKYDLSPKEKYLALLSQEKVVPGSEEFISIEECLKRSVAEGNPELCRYFIEQGAGLGDALIQATSDKRLFDDLVKRYRVDIYADSILLKNIIFQAIDYGNYDLIEEIIPRASKIIIGEDAEDVMDKATMTGDYDLVTYLNGWLNLGKGLQGNDLNLWLLQTALFNIPDDPADPTVRERVEEYISSLIDDLVDAGRFEELAHVLVKVGDTNRVENFLNLADFEGMEYLGENILLDAVKYGHISVVRLIVEDPNRIFVNVPNRVDWYVRAYELAKTYDVPEIREFLERTLSGG